MLAAPNTMDRNPTLKTYWKSLPLIVAGLFGATVAHAQAAYSPQPLVIVADDLTPLDEGPLAHLDGLTNGGGAFLDNTALIVNGTEVRRLAAPMPLARELSFYMSRGLTVFVCQSAVQAQWDADRLPLIPGIRMLPDKKLPSNIAARFNSYCYTPPQKD